jgi:hypothetical protein
MRAVAVIILALVAVSACRYEPGPRTLAADGRVKQAVIDKQTGETFILGQPNTHPHLHWTEWPKDAVWPTTHKALHGACKVNKRSVDCWRYYANNPDSPF